MTIDTVSQAKSFGGTQGVYTHRSAVTGTEMTFAVFVPGHAPGTKLPVLWYLSGLTCTHANVMDKGEYRRACAEHGIVFIAPDTSPRGEDVPDDEAYDFGKKRDDNPHVRLLGQYIIRKEKPNFPMVFLSTGVDNALNDTAYVFGGGIRWRDDDLKYLIGSIPLR